MGALRNRMAEDLTLRRLSPSTIKTYLLYALKFTKHYGHSPAELGEEDIRAYLQHLIELDLVSHQAYRQSVAALKFLYTVTLGRPWEIRVPFPKHQRKLPAVLSAREVAALLGWECASTVEEAVAMARSEQGQSASITCLHAPPILIAEVS